MKIQLTTLLLVTLTTLLSACASYEPLRASLENDLEEMLSWFPGEYDNDQQVQQQLTDGVEQAKRQRHTHHLFQPVDVSFTESQTLYAQQYQHYDPDDLYRQRIYAFDIDQNEAAIRLTIYTPKDPAGIRDLHLNKSLQATLTAKDFVLKPGCEVYWRRNEKGFAGYLKPDSCSYYSKRFKTTVYLNETLLLTKDALHLHDTAMDSKGNPVFGSADKGPTVNLKTAP